MKYIASLLFLFFLALSTIAAQRIGPPKPVIVKITSTECNVCGLLPWDVFHDVIDRHKNEAVIMSIHPLEVSSLFSQTALDFANNLPSFFGTPMFYINKVQATDVILQTTKDYFENANLRKATVQPFINYTIKDNELAVKINTKFYTASNRPHYLSVYVLENQVTANQASRSLEEKHAKVLRTHLNEDAFGTLLSEQEILEGQEFSHSFTKGIDTAWNPENLEIATIIWEKKGETFEIVNAEAANQPVFSTALNYFEKEGINMNIQPTLLKDAATIQLTLPKTQKGIKLNIINSFGQVVKTVFSGDLLAGKSTFQLTSNDFGSNGIHFLVLEKDGQQLVQKIGKF